jgi:hypothetical protein
MKEDNADREKRCASIEKHRTTQDTEKKKEKRRNIKRQALEQRRAQPRREGRPKEHSSDEDDDDDSEGMAARLDRILQVPPQAGASPSHAEASKGPQGREHEGR